MKRALMLIDIQNTFRDGSWGPRNNDSAEEQSARLLAYFRETKELVIHVNHISKSPESRFFHQGEGFDFQDMVRPLEGELVISKTVNSAFIGTKLKEYLDDNKVDTLIIAGLTTPHCVSTTTRMAGNYGFATYLVEDATAAFDLRDPKGNIIPAQTIHEISLATLHDEFATIVTTEAVINEEYSKEI
ncbi:isochorismatase [Streptococcus acidominimus]|uniref:Isochorismatase n=2 Tax=Streptococcus TaxID=1301 RepID=A0A239WEV8_STRAI|nr:isochorismatase [Streptococcus acidominimus]